MQSSRCDVPPSPGRPPSAPGYGGPGPNNLVPGSPSVKHRPPGHMTSTGPPIGYHGYQPTNPMLAPGQMHRMPSGLRKGSEGDPTNMSRPARPPSLHAHQGQGRSLESPFDHGYFSVGSNAGTGSHDGSSSTDHTLPRVTPPPIDEQTSKEKVLQYLGQQQTSQNQAMGGSGQGMSSMASGGMPGQGAMSQFNTQMPPQQEMPRRPPSDQMFNYKPAYGGMQGMAPTHHSGQGPGGGNYTPRRGGGYSPYPGSQSQGFNFEHPMSQRYPQPYNNQPNYGQTPVNVAQPKMSADFTQKNFNFQSQGPPMGPGMTPSSGGQYQNYPSNQSSPDGYERSNLSRAKKQRLDSNIQGLQYEPPTTLKQPLVNMNKGAMYNSNPYGPGSTPGNMPNQGNMPYQSGTPYGPGGPMRGPYPQSQPQTPAHMMQGPGQYGQRTPNPAYMQQSANQIPPGHQGPPMGGQQMTPQYPGGKTPQQGMNSMTPMSSMTPGNSGYMNQATPGGAFSNQAPPSGGYGSQKMSNSQSYAALKAQLPPYQPGTQDFVQHLVTDRYVMFN